jgi:phospholipid/cholesterol/gamma-HCH transport system substrate-binding protein
VPLGQVTEIETSAGAYEADVPLEKRRSYIVVRARVSGSEARVREWQLESAAMVKNGLRAQTALAGITGQQYLALDLFDPRQNPPLPFDWTPKYPYVPSAPSIAGELIANVQKFLASLNAADVEALGQNLNKLIVRLSTKVDQLPVAELSTDASSALKDARAAIDRLNAILARPDVDATLRNLASATGRADALLADPGLKQSVDNTAALTGRLRGLADSGDLDRMVKSIDDVTTRIDALVADNQYDVRVIVQDLRVTANNLRTLSETLKRYPAGALVGGPPEKLELPGKSP